MMHAQESSRPRETFFAPAGRAEPEEFGRQRTLVEDLPLLREALDAMPDMVMILNAQRQIVVANDAALRTLKTTVADVLAKRPGEAACCARAKEGPDGCGTAPHCATCGAVQAILESRRQNAQVVRECRIQVDGPAGITALDLRVTASPIFVEGQQFIVVVLEDISQTKRLAVLQRVFFHDVLNTVSAISSFAYCLAVERQLTDEVCEILEGLGKQLAEEITAQRDLVAAESGDLAVRVEPVQTTALLKGLRDQYAKHSLAAQRNIVLRDVWDGTIRSDRRLLLRVLGNMLKNALEATTPGRTVAIDCLDRGPSVMLAVHNPEAMPEEVQLQVFQRSFSTKEQPGRGIGTYSMKLLGERYLGGQVAFSSGTSTGTTFTLTLPKHP
jgi:hypothetical protein